MSANEQPVSVAASPLGVGDAVGVDIRRWYVAIVNNNSERVVEERLQKLNYETYVAKQTVFRVWKNGRKAKVDKILLPSLVFVKCTGKERLQIVTLPYINRFMTNRAGRSVNSLSKPLAIIPQKQIDTLRFMLGQSDIPVSMTDAPYRVHDRVVVLRGCLKGLEGEVFQTVEGKSELIIRIDVLGCAKMLIDTKEIERIS